MNDLDRELINKKLLAEKVKRDNLVSNSTKVRVSIPDGVSMLKYSYEIGCGRTIRNGMEIHLNRVKFHVPDVWDCFTGTNGWISFENGARIKGEVTCTYLVEHQRNILDELKMKLGDKFITEDGEFWFDSYSDKATMVGAEYKQETFVKCFDDEGNRYKFPESEVLSFYAPEDKPYTFQLFDYLNELSNPTTTFSGEYYKHVSDDKRNFTVNIKSEQEYQRIVKTINDWISSLEGSEHIISTYAFSITPVKINVYVHAMNIEEK